MRQGEEPRAALRLALGLVVVVVLRSHPRGEPALELPRVDSPREVDDGCLAVAAAQRVDDLRWGGCERPREDVGVSLADLAVRHGRAHVRQPRERLRGPDLRGDLEARAAGQPRARVGELAFCSDARCGGLVRGEHGCANRGHERGDPVERAQRGGARRPRPPLCRPRLVHEVREAVAHPFELGKDLPLLGYPAGQGVVGRAVARRVAPFLRPASLGTASLGTASRGAASVQIAAISKIEHTYDSREGSDGATRAREICGQPGVTLGSMTCSLARQRRQAAPGVP
ncbi:hypothetical protein [Cellulomonas persica]